MPDGRGAGGVQMVATDSGTGRRGWGERAGGRSLVGRREHSLVVWLSPVTGRALLSTQSVSCRVAFSLESATGAYTAASVLEVLSLELPGREAKPSLRTVSLVASFWEGVPGDRPLWGF